MKWSDIPMIKCTKCGAMKVGAVDRKQLKHFPWCPKEA